MNWIIRSWGSLILIQSGWVHRYFCWGDLSFLWGSQGCQSHPGFVSFQTKSVFGTTHRPSNRCFRKSKSAFCIISVTCNIVKSEALWQISLIKTIFYLFVVVLDHTQCSGAPLGSALRNFMPGDVGVQTMVSSHFQGKHPMHCTVNPP